MCLRFEGSSWSHLSRQKGTQGNKSGLAQGHLWGRGSKSGHGQRLWKQLRIGAPPAEDESRRSKSMHLVSHMIRPSLSIYKTYIYTQRPLLAPDIFMPSDTPHVSSLVCRLFSDVFHMLVKGPHMEKVMFPLGKPPFSATHRLLWK